MFGPQDWKEVLRRKLGRGAIPFKMDEREAWNSARRGLGPKEQVRGDFLWRGRDYAEALKKIGYKEMPEDLQSYLASQEGRLVFRVDFYKKNASLEEGALYNYASDLSLLEKAGAISTGEANERWERVQRDLAHEKTKGRMGFHSQQLSEQFFGASIRRRYRDELKRANIEPPSEG